MKEKIFSTTCPRAVVGSDYNTGTAEKLLSRQLVTSLTTGDTPSHW